MRFIDTQATVTILLTNENEPFVKHYSHWKQKKKKNDIEIFSFDEEQIKNLITTPNFLMHDTDWIVK